MPLSPNKRRIKMFDRGSRFITRGINSELPFKLHCILWQILDEFMANRKHKRIDYLQVLRIHKEKDYIKIIHSQEAPLYKKEIILKRNDIILERSQYKIFIIDDGEHSTMMLAEEY